MPRKMEQVKLVPKVNKMEQMKPSYDASVLDRLGARAAKKKAGETPKPRNVGGIAGDGAKRVNSVYRMMGQ